MLMRRIYYELRGAAKERVLDKWRKWVEDLIERSGKDPKVFGYDPDLIEEFLKERCEETLEESECYKIISKEILGRTVAEREYYDELGRYADALLNDIIEQFKVDRVTCIRKSFSDNPRDYPLNELCEDYVKSYAAAKYSTDFELYSVMALQPFLRLYNTPYENVYSHMNYLKYLGYREGDVSDVRGLVDNVFYTELGASGCYYSPKDHIIILCDKPAMIVNARKKIYVPLGSY